jgi:hypothetical protein
LVVIENSLIFVSSLKQINMNKHLEFYNNCMETGNLQISDGSGLCCAAKEGLISNELLDIFTPTHEDEDELDIEGLSVGWWASGVNRHDYNVDDEKRMGFTPLRQTVVAFMAVIKIEDFS